MMHAHWSDAYLGRPYGSGDDGCAALCEAAQRDVFSREIEIPTEARARAASGEVGAVLRRHIQYYVHRTDAPRDGDLVVMSCGGRRQHVGLYCELASGPHVLHALRNVGQAVRHPILTIHAHGIAIRRYYTWRQ
jgi:hypothetical protein